MSKVKAIRSNAKFAMYHIVARKRGRGAKFQWNAKSKFSIVFAQNKRETKIFNSIEEADKEWVFLTLSS